jgi:hypothetical protein
MIKKRISIDVHQKRSVTQFFNRIVENFERKFDGFPALPADPNATPAYQESAGGFVDFNVDDLIDDSYFPDSSTPPCADNEGEVINETLVYDSGSWEPSQPVKHYSDVYFDSLLAVKDIDYSDSTGSIIPVGDLDPDTVVTARYVPL